MALGTAGMKSGNMIDMGMKRKEIHGPAETQPKAEKDYENEKVYPELHVEGALAEMMGAEDLKKGDVVEQTVRWRVKELSKHEVDGKPARFTMTLCLEKATDCKDCADEGDGEDDDDAEEKPSGSAAMDYIRGQAKAAE